MSNSTTASLQLLNFFPTNINKSQGMMSSTSMHASMVLHREGYSSSFLATNASTLVPMTIFYGGSVHVFNVPSEKGDDLLRMVEMGHVSHPSPAQEQLQDLVNGDLTVARKASLRRFFERRKERLLSTSSCQN